MDSVSAPGRRLRFPFESLASSKSSVLANHAKGAVTIFLMVPRRVDFERARGGLRANDFGFRRWLLCELLEDIGIIAEHDKINTH